MPKYPSQQNPFYSRAQETLPSWLLDMVQGNPMDLMVPLEGKIAEGFTSPLTRLLRRLKGPDASPLSMDEQLGLADRTSRRGFFDQAAGRPKARRAQLENDYRLAGELDNSHTMADYIHSIDEAGEERALANGWEPMEIIYGGRGHTPGLYDPRGSGRWGYLNEYQLGESERPNALKKALDTQELRNFADRYAGGEVIYEPFLASRDFSDEPFKPEVLRRLREAGINFVEDTAEDSPAIRVPASQADEANKVFRSIGDEYDAEFERTWGETMNNPEEAALPGDEPVASWTRARVYTEDLPGSGFHWSDATPIIKADISRTEAGRDLAQRGPRVLDRIGELRRIGQTGNPVIDSTISATTDDLLKLLKERSLKKAGELGAEGVPEISRRLDQARGAIRAARGSAREAVHRAAVDTVLGNPMEDASTKVREFLSRWSRKKRGR